MNLQKNIPRRHVHNVDLPLRSLTPHKFLPLWSTWNKITITVQLPHFHIAFCWTAGSLTSGPSFNQFLNAIYWKKLGLIILGLMLNYKNAEHPYHKSLISKINPQLMSLKHFFAHKHTIVQEIKPLCSRNRIPWTNYLAATFYARGILMIRSVILRTELSELSWFACRETLKTDYWDRTL